VPVAEPVEFGVASTDDEAEEAAALPTTVTGSEAEANGVVRVVASAPSSATSVEEAEVAISEHERATAGGEEATNERERGKVR